MLGSFVLLLGLLLALALSGAPQMYDNNPATGRLSAGGCRLYQARTLRAPMTRARVCYECKQAEVAFVQPKTAHSSPGLAPSPGSWSGEPETLFQFDNFALELRKQHDGLVLQPSLTQTQPLQDRVALQIGW